MSKDHDIGDDIRQTWHELLDRAKLSLELAEEKFQGDDADHAQPSNRRSVTEADLHKVQGVLDTPSEQQTPSLKAWLRAELDLLEDTVLDRLLALADRTTVEEHELEEELKRRQQASP